MSEMVERVARAICQNVHGGNDPCTEDYQAARTAIEAMREPTEAMVAAFHPAVDVWMDESTSVDEDVWRAMIDAALASEPKP